jgi:hypothetical protein
MCRSLHPPSIRVLIQTRVLITGKLKNRAGCTNPLMAGEPDPITGWNTYVFENLYIWSCGCGPELARAHRTIVIYGSPLAETSRRCRRFVCETTRQKIHTVCRSSADRRTEAEKERVVSLSNKSRVHR